MTVMAKTGVAMTVLAMVGLWSVYDPESTIDAKFSLNHIAVVKAKRSAPSAPDLVDETSKSSSDFPTKSITSSPTRKSTSPPTSKPATNPPTSNKPTTSPPSPSPSNKPTNPPTASNRPTSSPPSPSPTKKPTPGPKASTPAQVPAGGSAQFCTREEIRDGSWESVQAMLPYEPVDLRCGDYRDKNGTFRLGPHNTYDWQPKNSRCQFQPFHRNQFCDLFQKKLKQTNTTTTIGLSGDSLTYEHFCSLVQSMGLTHKPGDGNRKLRKGHPPKVHRAVCDGALNIAFLRNDYLGATYDKFLSKVEPDILVLNKGAHFVEDVEFLQSLNQTVVDLMKWQRADPNRKLIWRTSVPGHPGCKNHKEPINNLTQMETLVENQAHYEKFHWWEFKRQNQLVEDYLNTVEGLNFQMMDGYHVNILRPDHHLGPGDCLHSCYPGKMDVYNQLLLNILQSWDTYDPR